MEDLLEKFSELEKTSQETEKSKTQITVKQFVKQKDNDVKQIEIKLTPKIKTIDNIPFNKSIELNSIKTIYANRFGTSTNAIKEDMQNAIINAWKLELKKGGI